MAASSSVSHVVVARAAAAAAGWRHAPLGRQERAVSCRGVADSLGAWAALGLSGQGTAGHRTRRTTLLDDGGDWSRADVRPAGDRVGPGGGTPDLFPDADPARGHRPRGAPGVTGTGVGPLPGADGVPHPHGTPRADGAGSLHVAPGGARHDGARLARPRSPAPPHGAGAQGRRHRRGRGRGYAAAWPMRSRSSSDAMPPLGPCCPRRPAGSRRTSCDVRSRISRTIWSTLVPRRACRRGAHEPPPLCAPVQAGDWADAPPVRDHVPDGAGEAVAGRDRRATQRHRLPGRVRGPVTSPRCFGATSAPPPKSTAPGEAAAWGAYPSVSRRGRRGDLGVLSGESLGAPWAAAAGPPGASQPRRRPL